MLVNDTSTTSKRSLWPEKTRGLWVRGALDSSLILTNGRTYDDWASGLGTNTLGYWNLGHCSYTPTTPATSLPWKSEQQLAEDFCLAMNVDAVRFFKTGSDAVSCAVRLARAYTGRNRVIVFDKSYHGTGDWFGPGLHQQAGIPMQETYVYPFGQRFDSTLFQDVAAIVVEPVPKAIELPPEGWLQHLREVCQTHNILLISDEVVLGYRHTLRGYLDSVGIRADLLCYGKAMGQGAAISACCGRGEIMSLLKDFVHFSGTNNGEPTALAIAQYTLAAYQSTDVCKELAWNGQYLQSLLLKEGFQVRGLEERFEIVDTKDAVEFCFDHDILYPGFCSMTVKHNRRQMEALVQTLCRWRETISPTGGQDAIQTIKAQ